MFCTFFGVLYSSLLLPREGGLHPRPLQRRLQAAPVRLRPVHPGTGVGPREAPLHLGGRQVRPGLLRGQLVGAAGLQPRGVQGLAPLRLAGGQVRQRH